MLQKAQDAMRDGELSRLAQEVAEHKRDPYSAIEEIANRAQKG
jgi:hypothetical protein